MNTSEYRYVILLNRYYDECAFKYTCHTMCQTQFYTYFKCSKLTVFVGLSIVVCSDLLVQLFSLFLLGFKYYIHTIHND